MNRREFLIQTTSSILTATTMTAANSSFSALPGDSRNSASLIEDLNTYSDQVSRNLWNRFISPDNIIYDYVGLNGEISLPSPEECLENKPNALGWWSPIEDGAFFTGDYLLGLFIKYDLNPTDKLKTDIKKLVSGLYKLQDVCKTPGMIARGIGSDGKCHYNASSNDQNIPWILAMWKYLSSGIPTEEEKIECRTRLMRHIQSLKKLNWTIPGEVEGFERGSFLQDENPLESCNASIHIAIITKILADISGDEEEELHQYYLDTRLESGKTRREIISEGFSSVEWKNGYSWFTSHAQYAVRELYRMEKNPEHKELYKQGLQKLAETAAEGILCYKHYDKSKNYKFTPEWRVMLTEWSPQNSCVEAVAVAIKELAVWNKAYPAVKEEKSTLLYSIPAAWIVMMSEDHSLIKQWLPEIVNAIKWFDYDKLHYGSLFFVENVIQEISAISDTLQFNR